MTLPDGSGPVAMTVDNRSGFWMIVYPGATFVPPYTLGAVVAFTAPAPSVDLLFAPTGPTGQVSTLASDPISTVTATLYDAAEAPPADPGTAYVDQFTPILDAQVDTTSQLSGSVTGFVGAGLNPPLPTGTRIRLLYVKAYCSAYDGGFDGPQNVIVAPSSGQGHIIPLVIGHGVLSDAINFPPGLDYSVGQTLSVTAIGAWNSAAVSVKGLYQAI